jgi:hypothetical protein
MVPEALEHREYILQPLGQYLGRVGQPRHWIQIGAFDWKCIVIRRDIDEE